MLTWSSIGLKCSFTSLAAREGQPYNGTVQTNVRREADLLGPRSGETAVANIARFLMDKLACHVDPYLEGFNMWLPVVDGSTLKARARVQEALEDERFSTLLVTCALLSRISRPKLSEPDVKENQGLYMALIISHTSMSSKGSRSMDVLQSKILLALYEHLQADQVAAVGTLSSAVEIARAMGIVQWHCMAEHRTIFLGSEDHRTLCCLYVLER